MRNPACSAGTTTGSGSSATTTRPHTKILLTYHGHTDRATAVAWSHNGQRIAAVTQEYCGDVCAVVMTWDAKTGKHLVFYPDVTVYAIAWSPDDTRFASAIESSDVQIALVP